MLIATEERIAAEPELVGAVVRASVKGWEKYLAEPEATNRHINSLNPEMGMDILAYGAAESIAMVLDPVAQQNGLGSMTLQRWQELLEQMVTVDLIKDGVVDPTAVFTNRFLALALGLFAGHRARPLPRARLADPPPRSAHQVRGVFALTLAAFAAPNALALLLLGAFLLVVTALARVPWRLILRQFKTFAWLFLFTFGLHALLTPGRPVLPLPFSDQS